MTVQVVPLSIWVMQWQKRLAKTAFLYIVANDEVGSSDGATIAQCQWAILYRMSIWPPDTAQ